MRPNQQLIGPHSLHPYRPLRACKVDCEHSCHATSHSDLILLRQYKRMPGVTTYEIPDTLKILDRKKAREQTPHTIQLGATPTSTIPIAPASATMYPVTNPESQPPSGPHATRNFPLAVNWLRSLADDMERGRDGLDYLSLIPLFESNAIVRLDDIDALQKEGLLELACGAGVELKVGLINRIVRYAAEDVKVVNKQSGW